MVQRCRRTGVFVVTTLVAGVLATAPATAGSVVEDGSGTRRAHEDMTSAIRVATSVARREPRTTRIRLRGGHMITVWRVCVVAKGLSAKKRAVGVEEARLVPLRRAVRSAERTLGGFLEAHPERSLAPDAYTRYKALDHAYRLALSRYNAQIGRYNAAVDAHNDVLRSCKV